MPPGVAKIQHIALATGAVAASFWGFYYALGAQDGRKQASGRIDQYESTLVGLRNRGSHFPISPAERRSAQLPRDNQPDTVPSTTTARGVDKQV
ncbi:hypothetical protein PM082_017661 [Marasmius tenuissimus]|nr:hypothetical protein PM082_017661 [Marasmius tenuissimus]